MLLDERVLGFDARALSGYRSRPRPLRTDVERLLSVDAAIWPSIFHVDDLIDSTVGFDTVHRDPWTGWNGILWDRLDELETRLGELATTSLPSYAVIAVTSWRAAADATAKPDNAWCLLGFDVADEWLDSGLTNLWSDAPPSARDRYANRLNEHHLFAVVDDALDFRVYSDGRIPSHAPFIVYGLDELTGAPSNGAGG